MRAAAALLVSLFSLEVATAAPRALPIYIEDDHAGSFYHLAATLDLYEPHALLLIDAHSDATAVADSDAIRTGLRRVRSRGERESRLNTWRRSGRVQAFSWIEPLMPAPFASVCWLAPEGGDEAAQVAEAREQLDSRLGFDSRKSGALGARFRRVGEDFAEALPADLPVVVSIDLDYFADTDPSEVGARFDRLWSQVLALPRLHAITFCISRPWLADDAMAHALIERALRLALSVRNADLTFEPFAPRGPDRSERAKDFFRRRESPPRYDIGTAPASLRGLLHAESARVRVLREPERWQAMLDEWRAESGAWRVIVDDAEPSTDEIWRLNEPATLRVRSSPRRPVPQQVRWIAFIPERMVHNVMPEIPSGKVFAKAATPFVRDHERVLATTEDGALAADAWRNLLDAETGWGSVRIAAVVREGETSGWRRTSEIEIRVAQGQGFRATLAEQFNLPYVFGAGFLAGRGETGPETRAGNDCANYLVYAWRRCGRRIGWCDPLRLRPHLRLVASDLDVDSVTPIDVASIDRGLVVHCGVHVAAVWHDREPFGALDAGDIVAHHLSGPPELITLRELLAARPNPTYDLMAMPPADNHFELIAGGDLCLAGLESSSASLNLPSFLRDADLAVANFECTLTRHREPARQKRYLFRAEPGCASLLRDAGFDAFSLANNHSGDFGDAGRGDTVDALRVAGMASFGLEPWIHKTGTGELLAFFGINFIENEKANDDARILSQGIAKSKADGATVIVFPHWGEEFTSKTTDVQRARARWLVNCGADIVVGAGPHCLQPLDFYRGRPIFYSLGNAFFPPRGPVPDGFHEAHWARILFNAKGRLQAADLVGK